jgi:hypothetical protein
MFFESIVLTLLSRFSRTLCLSMSNPDWIIILFVIYLDAFRVEKLEESACRVILVASPSLENWGMEPSRAILRH